MADKSMVTVTLNPALDLTVQLNELQPGAVNLARDGNLRPAGKGINVARVLRDLGQPVKVTGILGDDNRQPFQALFERHGMVDHFVTESGATRINVKLSETSGRVTDINLPGLKVSDHSWVSLQARVSALCDTADCFLLCGSLPRGLAPDSYATLVRQLKARGKTVLVDTSGAALAAAIAAGPDLIKPNLEELAQWAGEPLNDVAARDRAVAEVQAQGVRQVVVSDGSRGLDWYADNEVWRAVPPAVEVISTVGAGDSLLAGIAYGLVARLDKPAALRLATAAAALAVNQIGVGIPDDAQFQQIQQQITVDRRDPAGRAQDSAEEDPCKF